MKLRRSAVAALFVLAGTAPASMADDWNSWTGIFADFFMGPETKEEFHWSGSLAAGRTLEIKGVNGAVAAEAAPGSSIIVEATKTGRKSQPRDVRIEVVEHDGGVTLCAVYPSPSGAPNECLPGTKGRMSTRNNDVSVHFRVKVPAGVRFVARTVNGSVKASGLTADTEAYTVNGSVALETAGQAQAETVNGSITASLGKSGEALRFETVNGSITLDMPAGTNASLDAETTNGRISSDFPVAATKQSKTRLVGAIGQGGKALSLETVNGSIQLRKR